MDFLQNWHQNNIFLECLLQKILVLKEIHVITSKFKDGLIQDMSGNLTQIKIISLKEIFFLPKVRLLQQSPKIYKCKGFLQGMSCEGACAHAHVRCAVARVRAKSILKSVWDVRACGSFLGVRCATVFFHTFGTKLP